MSGAFSQAKARRTGGLCRARLMRAVAALALFGATLLMWWGLFAVVAWATPHFPVLG